METLDDILREMRSFINTPNAKRTVRGSFVAGVLIGLAGRIEKAVHQTGEVRYQIQEPVKGKWTNVYSTCRLKRVAKFSAESSSAAAKNLGQNSQRRIVKVIQTEEVVWENK